MSLPDRCCEDCGRRLTPCPARWDGEDTYVGFYRCSCAEAREEDAERAEWNAPAEDVIEVCNRCGDDRARADFYGTGCKPIGPDGDPEPAGEHEWVIVTRDETVPR